MKHILRYGLIVFLAVAAIFFLLSVVGPRIITSSYDSEVANKSHVALATSSLSANAANIASSLKPVLHVATHIETPVAVKALYMTSWVAGTPSIRENVVSIIEKTEANAVVIDIKDYTGRVAFEPNDPALMKIGSSDKRIADIDAFIDELHSKGIYVIGRIAAFQDPYMVKLHPEWAVRRASDGGIWKDYKGISWIDPGAKGMWDYLANLSKESHSRGFDEINFDYIRFPSDGNMRDIAYTFSSTTKKAKTMESFYEFINKELKKDNITISADLFGMTTTASDDMNIGQVLVDALKNFDYVSPMVYPSHFPATWNGYKNPAAVPYEVVKASMGSAVARAEAASTSPLKLRPWLQDFNLGAVYTPAMVKAEMQATYDVGLTSWMIWDPNNKFTSSKAAMKAE